jgi:hypothetical protein
MSSSEGSKKLERDLVDFESLVVKRHRERPSGTGTGAAPSGARRS